MNEDELPEIRIPLYRVGEWIATGGGARDLGPSSIIVENKDVPDYRFSFEASPVHARAWDKALGELLKAIHGGGLPTEGLRNGDAGAAFERIPPGEFGEEAANPFGSPFETCFSERRILEIDYDSAKISNRWHIYWSEIRACSRKDVLAIWPAATVKASSSYISLPEAWKKFWEAESQADHNESAALDARLEKFRETVALPLSKATYCQRPRGLKRLPFENWFEVCKPSLLKSDWPSLPMAVVFERDAFDALNIVRTWRRAEAPSPMTDDDLRKWLQEREAEIDGRPPIRTWSDARSFFQDRHVTKPQFERVWGETYPAASPGRPPKNARRNAPKVSNAKESLEKLAK